MASKRNVVGTTIHFEGDFKDLQSQIDEVMVRVSKGAGAAVKTGVKADLDQVVRETNTALDKLAQNVRGRIRRKSTTDSEVLQLKQLITLIDQYKVKVSTSEGLLPLIKGVKTLKDANDLIKESRNNVKQWSAEVSNALKDVKVKPKVDYSELNKAEKDLKSRLAKSKSTLNLNIAPERKEKERALQDQLTAQLRAFQNERQKMQHAEQQALKRHNAHLEAEQKRADAEIKRRQNKSLADEKAYSDAMDRINNQQVTRRAKRAVKGLANQDYAHVAATGKTLPGYDFTEVDGNLSAHQTRINRLQAVQAAHAARAVQAAAAGKTDLEAFHRQRSVTSQAMSESVATSMESLQDQRETARLRKEAQMRREQDRANKPPRVPFQPNKGGFRQNWSKLGNLSAVNHLVTNAAQISGTSLYGLGTVGALTGVIGGSVKAAAEAEQTKTILAGLINTFTTFSDAAGKAENAQGNYNRSIIASENLYKTLRLAADKSILTTKELLTFYTTGYAAGGKSGLTSEQILYIVERLGTLGKATGLRELDTQQDIRSIVSPGARLDATNKTASYLGISGKDRDEAFKDGPEGFIKLLKEKLKGMDFALKTFENSFSAKWSTLIDKVQQVGIKFGEVIIPYLLPQIDKITKKLQDWAESGKAEEFAQDLGKIAQAVGDAASGFAGFVIDARMNLLQTSLTGVAAGMLLLAGRCAVMSLTSASSPVLLAIAALSALGIAITSMSEDAANAQRKIETRNAYALDAESSNDPQVVERQRMAAVRASTSGRTEDLLMTGSNLIKQGQQNSTVSNYLKLRMSRLKSVYDAEPRRKDVFGDWETFKNKAESAGVFTDPLKQKNGNYAGMGVFGNLLGDPTAYGNPETYKGLKEFADSGFIPKKIYKVKKVDPVTGETYLGEINEGQVLRPTNNILGARKTAAGTKTYTPDEVIEEDNPLYEMYSNYLKSVRNGGRYAVSENQTWGRHLSDVMTKAGFGRAVPTARALYGPKGIVGMEAITPDSPEFLATLHNNMKGWKRTNPQLHALITRELETRKNGLPKGEFRDTTSSTTKPLTTESLMQKVADTTAIDEQLSQAQILLESRKDVLNNTSSGSLQSILSKFGMLEKVRDSALDVARLERAQKTFKLPELQVVERATAAGKKAGVNTDIKPLSMIGMGLVGLPGVEGTPGMVVPPGVAEEGVFQNIGDKVVQERIMNDKTGKYVKTKQYLNEERRKKKQTWAEYFKEVAEVEAEIKSYQDEYLTMIYESASEGALSYKLRDIESARDRDMELRGFSFADSEVAKATNESEMASLEEQIKIRANKYYNTNGRVDKEATDRILNYFKTGDRSGISDEEYAKLGLEKTKVQFDNQRGKLVRESKFRLEDTNPWGKTRGGLRGFIQGVGNILKQNPELSERYFNKVVKPNQDLYDRIQDGIVPEGLAGDDLAVFNIRKEQTLLEKNRAKAFKTGNWWAASRNAKQIRDLDLEVDGITRRGTRATYLTGQAQAEAGRRYDGAGPRSYAELAQSKMDDDMSKFENQSLAAQQKQLADMKVEGASTMNPQQAIAAYRRQLTLRGASTALSGRRADDLTNAALKFATAPKGENFSAFGAALSGYGTDALISDSLNSLLRNQYNIPLDGNGNERYTKKGARTGAFANVAAGLAVNALFDSQSSYSNEGANIGGMIGSMIPQLGPFGGAIGALGGGFLGSLFGKKQVDPADEAYKSTIKRILSDISHNTRPVGDFYRTKAGAWGADSMYLSNRAIGFGMVAGV